MSQGYSSLLPVDDQYELDILEIIGNRRRKRRRRIMKSVIDKTYLNTVYNFDTVF